MFNAIIIGGTSGLGLELVKNYIKITKLYFGDEFKYKYARILREPPRVEIVETR